MRRPSFINISGTGLDPYSPAAVVSAVDETVNVTIPVENETRCLIINGPVSVPPNGHGEYEEAWDLRYTRISGAAVGDTVEATGNSFVANENGRFIVAALGAGGFGWTWPKLK